MSPTSTGSRAFSAIVFDLDGTLVDSYQAITASVNHVRANWGLPPLAESEVRLHVGRGPIHLLERTVPHAPPDQALAEYKAHHHSVLRSGTRLLPNVSETLAALHGAGFRKAVCSNKLHSFSVKLLEYLNIATFIELVVGPEDAPRPKPAPDMLLAAIERLALPPHRVLYVGDMNVDVETARGAGVTVWVIPTGSNDRQTLEASKPDRVLRSFREVLEANAARG